MNRRAVKWLLRIAVTLIVLYAGLLGSVTIAMLQPPERFGRFMRHMPMPLVWGLLPAKDLWLWARRGTLREGEMAPDFTLPAQDGSGTMTLSSHRGARPVVLVFGSYT